MPIIRIKNTAPVAIHGKAPGQEFSIEVDGDGVPLDRLWRKRFSEGAINAGHLAILSPAASPEASKPVEKPSAKSPAKPAPKE